MQAIKTAKRAAGSGESREASEYRESKESRESRRAREASESRESKRSRRARGPIGAIWTLTAALLLAGCGSNAGTGGGAGSEASGLSSGDKAASAGSEASELSSGDKAERMGEGAGASSGASGEAETKLKVVTTFYPMYEFSRQVAGDNADVVALVPAGAEPHDWEPSAKDMALIADADVFVYNGIVEGWAEKALASAGNADRIVVKASEGIALKEGVAEEEDDHGHGDEAEGAEDRDHDHGHELDPHVWLDPSLAKREVSNIEAALAKADPEHAADYASNAEAFNAKLSELDQAFRDGLKDAKRKEFVTQHAAFGYLAKAYGLTQVPISGLSPDQEPSPERMADIVKEAKRRDVKTIFFETLVDPKVARTIADEIGAATDVLNPLEGLTDEDRKNGLDYIGIMRNNLAALKKALNQ
ncbi:zinc ABC transporter substrate-binding protein [Cohnella xylanilytica]|uniref:Zinc ABC transporter substrate-binding protein n=2 Tax=Cohnella xylanilytica TaxID=557555 RepID=A0A841U1T3_9BACL|nr:zinc ABC transporter substrate-binding protein [Cohnella xylanilytica]